MVRNSRGEGGAPGWAMEVTSNIWSESREMIVWTGDKLEVRGVNSGSQRGSEILIEEGMVHRSRAWSVLGTMLKERSWPRGPCWRVVWASSSGRNWKIPLIPVNVIYNLSNDTSLNSLVERHLWYGAQIYGRHPTNILKFVLEIELTEWSRERVLNKLYTSACLDLILGMVWYEISPFVCSYSLIRKPTFKLNTQELQRLRTVTY